MNVHPGLPQAILTLDVEDWEHANFAQLDGQERHLAEASRDRRYAMDANTDRWIELLGEVSARSTCFVLGDFARRYPEAVRRLARAGHEIASHGDTHHLVYRMDQSGFREYLKRGLGELGQLLGSAPVGFRAPSWSVSREKTPWFCEELARQGIRYDSSEFPVKTPLFGNSDAPLKPHREGGLLRVPVTVLTIGPVRAPFSSGAFFRLSPLALIRFGLKRAIRSGLPAMVVLHPRELDPAHPRLPLRGWEASVHYARLGSTEPKLRALLREFDWRSIRDVYGSVLDTAGPTLDN
jgi:polysaccharide deacetylase family protein (PEP-CTERM system associated)